MVKFSVFLVFLISCSHRSENEIPLSSLWRGKSQDELLEHPYFKKIKVLKTPMQKSSQWLFIDQTPYQTGAYCQGLGGCLGLPSYNCQYHFKVKDGLIDELEVNGVCPPRKTIEPL